MFARHIIANSCRLGFAWFFSPSKSLKQTYQECLWVNQALVHLLQPRLTFLVGLVWTRDKTKVYLHMLAWRYWGKWSKKAKDLTITRVQFKINITSTLPLAFIHIGYILSFNTGLKKEMISDHPPAILWPAMPAILPLWEYCCRTWALLAAVASIAELLLMFDPCHIFAKKPGIRYTTLPSDFSKRKLYFVKISFFFAFNLSFFLADYE